MSRLIVGGTELHCSILPSENRIEVRIFTVGTFNWVDNSYENVLVSKTFGSPFYFIYPSEKDWERARKWADETFDNIEKYNKDISSRRE